ncbi:Hypothetical protein A7982_01456 [Minicystis rosea]|nr:Hypothetical protein A7982_01456 [Minicystis rosea]
MMGPQAAPYPRPDEPALDCFPAPLIAFPQPLIRGAGGFDARRCSLWFAAPV